MNDLENGGILHSNQIRNVSGLAFFAVAFFIGFFFLPSSAEAQSEIKYCKKQLAVACPNLCAFDAITRCAWLKPDFFTADCRSLIEIFFERNLIAYDLMFCDKPTPQLPSRISCAAARENRLKLTQLANAKVRAAFGISASAARLKLLANCHLHN